MSTYSPPLPPSSLFSLLSSLVSLHSLHSSLFSLQGHFYLRINADLFCNHPGASQTLPRSPPFLTSAGTCLDSAKSDLLPTTTITIPGGPVC